MLESLLPELVRLAGPQSRIRLFAGGRILGSTASLLEAEAALEAETYPSPSLYLWQQFGMGRAVSKFGPSVHLAPEGLLPLGLRPPAVGIVHDLLWLRYPTTCKAHVRAVYHGRFRSCLKRLAAVQYDSAFTRAEVRRVFPGCEPAVASVAPLGVDDAAFHPPTAEERTGLEAFLDRHRLEPSYILAVGNLRPHKNLRVLLEALKRLYESGNAVPPLAIVGAGSLGPELEVLRSTLPEGAVRTLGYLDEQELRPAYQGAGVFVFPSLYEGFGLPLLEAMSAGVPVVYARAAALPEVAGDAGLSFAPDDAGDLAGTLSRLLDDVRLREDLVEAGRARARGFTWRQTAEALWSTLERAAHETA